jgi:Methyltransferase domain
MKGTLTEPRIHTDLAEFYSLWRDACLGKWASEIEEVKFLLEFFSGGNKVRSIIDLGGSIGLHSIPLNEHGFDVTLLDKSQSALAIARRSAPQLQTVNGSFENIDLKQNFDAAICMFSSLNYLLSESDREHFYHWLSTYIRDVVILDQVNVRRLPRVYSDSCQAEDKHFRLNILREWHFEDEVMQTSFIYEFVDKESEATKIINDGQSQKFLTVEELVAYMGKQWRMVALLGECNLNRAFDPDNSPRMISIFKRV